MDKFLELPFWLSITLGVVYGVIWLVFFVVLYANFRRYHQRRHRSAMSVNGESSFTEREAFEAHASFGDRSEFENSSVYDEDDD